MLSTNDKRTGVYLIENILTGDCYVGSTSNSFKARLFAHRNDLLKNTHHNQRLQRAWNKYGEDNFSFLILAIVEPIKCIEYEQLYLDSYKPEYNLCLTAGSILGIKRNDAYKKAVSNKMQGNTIWTGRTHSEESKIKIGIANAGKQPYSKGRPMTQEQKEKISNTLKGHTLSAATREKISNTLKAKNKINEQSISS